MAELETWMREERAKLSKHAPVAKAIDYMLRRWDSFARFLEDGRIRKPGDHGVPTLAPIRSKNKG